jgi:hypothetical protein
MSTSLTFGWHTNQALSATMAPHPKVTQIGEAARRNDGPAVSGPRQPKEGVDQTEQHHLGRR